MNNLLRLNDDTRGATMVEYVVIITLIFLVAVAAWGRLGKTVSAKTDAAEKALSAPP